MPPSQAGYGPAAIPGGRPYDWTLAPVSVFGARLAGWWQRAGALVLDIIILSVPIFIVLWILFGVVFAAASTSSSSQPVCTGQGPSFNCSFATNFGWFWIVYLVALALDFIVPGLYFSLMNGTGNGQTVGNMATGIAVRDAQSGAVIGFGRGILRWLVRTLLYAFLLIPGVLSDLWPLWDPQNQTLADKACNTVMIRAR
jgi:uncharacterized RDD family membrane protein YckC